MRLAIAALTSCLLAACSGTVLPFGLLGSPQTFSALAPGDQATTNRGPYRLVHDHQGRIWVMAINSPKVTLLAPSGELLQAFDLGVNHHALAIDGQDQILLLTNDKRLQRVDGAGKVVGEVALPDEAGDLAVDAQGNAWITLRKGLVVVDPAGKLTPVDLEGAYVYHPTVDGPGNVWVASNQALFKLTSPNEPATSYPLGFAPYAMTGFSGGGVWASDDQGTVHRIAVDGSEVSRVPVGGVIYGMAQAPDGRIWVTQAGPGTGLDQVMPISPSMVLGQAYATGRNPGDVTIDASGRVWVLNVLDGSVTRVTPPPLATGSATGFEVLGSLVGPDGLVATVGTPLWLRASNGSAAAWKVSDPAIATVETDGKLTPLTAGAVNVTATVEGHDATATVVVREAAAQDVRPIRLPAGSRGQAPSEGGMLVNDQPAWDGLMRAFFKPLPPPSPAPTVPIDFTTRRVLVVSRTLGPSHGSAVVLRLAPTVLVGYPRRGGYNLTEPAIVLLHQLAAFDLPRVPDDTKVEVAGAGVVEPIKWDD